MFFAEKILARVFKDKKRGKIKMQSGVRTVRQQGFGNLRGMSLRNTSDRPRTSYLANAVSSGYSRNRNTVRHQARGIGRISAIAILVIEVFMIGLFYVSEQSKVTTYDYKMSAMDAQIANLEAERDDLKVEQARLNSIAKNAKSTVAANMETARVAGYAD